MYFKLCFVAVMQLAFGWKQSRTFRR